MTPEELLAAFHSEIRLRPPEQDDVPGMVFDTDGPVRRRYPEQPQTLYRMVECPEGLGDDPDHWIGRVVDFFTGRGESVEWKTYDYDEPRDLGSRLVARGFAKEDDEALMLGESAVLSEVVDVPPGVTLREATRDLDYDRIGDLHALVWGEEWRAHGEVLRLEQERDPEALRVIIAEEDPDAPALCAAWVRLPAEAEFCSMWGGTTHPDWRGQGLYRAVLARRAAIALEAGHPLVRVDASPDSEPILTRLGLHRVATTTPYVLGDPLAGA
ncbi:GNAT family N-acetyltransferase [Actinomycetota bacterium]